MPLQSLFIIFVFIIILPIIILTSHDEVFFIVLSFILFIASIRNLYGLILYSNLPSDSDEEDEDFDELEEFLGFDLEKLTKGLVLVKNLSIILYLSYCSFYISNNYVKLLVLSIALYWIYDIIMYINDNYSIVNNKFLSNLSFFVVNICTIFIIVLTTFVKYFGKGL